MGIDIADALLAVDAARAGDTVYSLDRDFEKLPVPWEPPPLSESRVSIPGGGDP
jgi:predicted nucleic acid-binding protein